MGHYHPVLGGTCPKCNGAGEVERPWYSFVSPALADARERMGQQKKRCRSCEGTGRVIIERRLCNESHR
jgi:DnaJ-class molecular chaperone